MGAGLIELCQLAARVTRFSDQMLMAAANPNLIRYLRRDAGVEPCRIKAALHGVIAGLGCPQPA